jgi:hypothetical protein
MSFESTELLDGRMRVVEEVMLTLTELFTEAGLKAMLFYLSTDYDTGLSDLRENPSKFKANFLVFLGDFGGNLILRRIEQRLARAGLRLSPAEDTEKPHEGSGSERAFSHYGLLSTSMRE